MSCAVKYCKNYRQKTRKTNTSITYHMFPADILVKERWIEATGQGADWFPNFRSVICSEHFPKESFITIGRHTHLKPDTIPTEKLTQCDESSTDVKSFSKVTNGSKILKRRPLNASRPQSRRPAIKNKVEEVPSKSEVKSSPNSSSVSYQYLVEEVDSIPITYPGSSSTMAVIKQEPNNYTIELIPIGPENSSNTVVVKQEQNNVDSISTTNPGSSSTTVVKKEQNIVDPVPSNTMTTEMLIEKLRRENKYYQYIAASRRKKIRSTNERLRRANKEIQSMKALLATLQKIK